MNCWDEQWERERHKYYFAKSPWFYYCVNAEIGCVWVYQVAQDRIGRPSGLLRYAGGDNTKRVKGVASLISAPFKPKDILVEKQGKRFLLANGYNFQDSFLCLINSARWQSWRERVQLFQNSRRLPRLWNCHSSWSQRPASKNLKWERIERFVVQSLQIQVKIIIR